MDCTTLFKWTSIFVSKLCSIFLIDLKVATVYLKNCEVLAKGEELIEQKTRNSRATNTHRIHHYHKDRVVSFEAHMESPQ